MGFAEWGVVDYVDQVTVVYLIITMFVTSFSNKWLR